MAPYRLSIDTALSGFETIELINDGKEYDVIFMDHMMPQMDGMETTKKLRKQGYEGIIVALTANALAGNDELFMQNGFNGFISKPIDIRQLNTVLNKFVRDRHSPEEREMAGKEDENVSILLDNADMVDTELLAIFNKDVRKTAPIIERIYQSIDTAGDGEWRTYIVHVHAMKSALANVGEKEASELAGILETAGKKKDITVIKTETPVFIEKLQVIIENTDVRDKDECVSVDEDVDYLRSQWALIINACDEYDDMAAEKILAELNKKQWSKETRELLDKIAEYILHSDFEAVVKEIKVGLLTR
jgi:CheY-like chemotaxis protein